MQVTKGVNINQLSRLSELHNLQPSAFKLLLLRPRFNPVWLKEDRSDILEILTGFKVQDLIECALEFA